MVERGRALRAEHGLGAGTVDRGSAPGSGSDRRGMPGAMIGLRARLAVRAGGSGRHRRASTPMNGRSRTHGRTSPSAAAASSAAWCSIPKERGLALRAHRCRRRLSLGRGAQRWSALTDWIGAEDVNLTGIESIAIDPSDPERVYLAAGTYTTPKVGNGAILRSQRPRPHVPAHRPAVQARRQRTGRGNGERLAVDPNDGRVLLFGSRTRGLWRSEDRGAHWSQVESFPAIATSCRARQRTRGARQPIGIVFVAFDAGQRPCRARRRRASTRAFPRAKPACICSDDAGATGKPVARPAARPAPQPHGPRQRRRLLPELWRRARARQRCATARCGSTSRRTGALDRHHAGAAIDRHARGDGFGWGAVAVDRARSRRC